MKKPTNKFDANFYLKLISLLLGSLLIFGLLGIMTTTDIVIAYAAILSFLAGRFSNA